MDHTQSKRRKIFNKESLSRALGAFTKKEWYVFIAFFAGLIIGTAGLLWHLNNRFLISVPAHGGSVSEGMIGTPRFINPVLALSDADRDLTSLVYSGLVRILPDGTVVPDLAEHYEVSDDNLTYTFTLRQDAVFHDGTPVTADDIVFTIGLAKNPLLKSPKRLNWEGVEVEKVDSHTIVFTLRQPYTAFIEYATMGILPSHLWQDLRPEEMSFSDLNTQSVGSGPYEITKVKKRSSGVPEYYELRAFNSFTLGNPYIRTLKFKFYANEQDLVEAVRDNDIDQASGLSPSYSAELESEGLRTSTSLLPRIFGVFFNQNQAPVLADKTVRTALDMAINKELIVQEILFGFASPIDSPIPSNVLSREAVTSFNKEKAIQILENNGWVLGEDNVRSKKDTKGTKRLEFSIATADSPELRFVAEYIKRDLAAIGANVDIRVYDIGTLNQTVIRPRKYDALLFGEIINHESDLFAFWHSSQRNDPGLNVALYTNSKVDGELEDIIGEQDRDTRIALYKKLDEEFTKDIPALFLYAPKFIYVIKDTIEGVDISSVTIPSDRFSNVYAWFTDTERVWKFFIPKSDR